MLPSFLTLAAAEAERLPSLGHERVGAEVEAGKDDVDADDRDGEGNCRRAVRSHIRASQRGNFGETHM